MPIDAMPPRATWCAGAVTEASLSMGDPSSLRSVGMTFGGGWCQPLTSFSPVGSVEGYRRPFTPCHPDDCLGGMPPPIPHVILTTIGRKDPPGLGVPVSPHVPHRTAPAWHFRSGTAAPPLLGRSLVAALRRDDIWGRMVPTPFPRVLLWAVWRDAAAPFPRVILTTLEEGSPMYRYVAVHVHRFDAAACIVVGQSHHRSNPADGKSRVAPPRRDVI